MKRERSARHGTGRPRGHRLRAGIALRADSMGSGCTMNDKERAPLEAEVASLRSELAFYKGQVIEAHQMISIGQLGAGIIHEINTPIGSILTNNEVTTRALAMLKEMIAKAQAAPGPPPPKAMKILATLENLAAVDKLACERIASVVRGLKTLAGGGCREYVKADVNEILDNTLKLAHCEFRRRVTVETDYGQLPSIECEPHAIGQVFLNILVNAGQAIEGEGTVRIRTVEEEGTIHVSISDTGSGIPPEYRERIFAGGFTTKPSGTGTGLGLAISQEIIATRHGGTIDFESEVGKGTTFHIRIPVARPPDRGEANLSCAPRES
jgi:signal transduction histidine kinase